MSQLTRSALTTDINSNIYNNSNRDISGLDVGDRMVNIIDSLVSREGDTNITAILRYSAAHSVSNAWDIVHKTYADALVSDTTYGVGWSGVTSIAPSKNAVYDAISGIDTSSLWDITGNTLASRGVFGSTSGAYGWDYQRNGTVLGGLGDSTGWYWGGASAYASTDHSFYGSGATSGTKAIWVKNSSSTSLFNIKNDGNMFAKGSVMGLDAAVAGSTLTLYGGTSDSTEYALRVRAQSYNDISLFRNDGVNAIKYLLCNPSSLTSGWDVSSAAYYYAESTDSATKWAAKFRKADFNNIIEFRSDGNIRIGTASQSFGSGVGVIFIANATTAPTGTPTAGGILYTESGALKYKGSSGTVTTLGVA